MKYYSSIIFFIFGIITLSCSSNKNKASDRIGGKDDSTVNTTNAQSSAEKHPIHNIFNDGHNSYDGEADHSHNLSPDELHYHAKRGVSTLEDAYLEGYDDGYEDGKEDGSEGHRYSLSYYPDSDFTGKFEDSYNDGYEDGYNDGYYSSLDSDDEDDD
ncbi:MAG: hypothetical protein K2H76_04365 [Muribaculaceae bacterium]|nr:hypothetical protein [Muribaculaceae bacterium]